MTQYRKGRCPTSCEQFGYPARIAQSEEQAQENKVKSREDTKQEEEQDKKQDSMKTLVELA